jgi:mannopine transport system permease protein
MAFTEPTVRGGALVKEDRPPAAWNPVVGWPVGLLLAAPLLVLLALLVVVPMVLVLWQSFAGTGLDGYRSFFESNASVTALRNTFVSSAIVTVLVVAAGGLLAWYLVTSRSLVLRAFVWMAVLAPLWMGVIIKNYVFTILLQDGGLLSSAWNLLPGEQSPSLMYTQAAVVLGVFYSMLPYAALPLYVTVKAIDLDLLKAAESLGATPVQAMRSVFLPLARPGIAATAIIVFVISLGFYVTPVLLGGVKSAYLPSLIDNTLFKYFNEDAAQVAAAILLIVATVVVAIAMRILGAAQLKRAVS